MASKITPKTYIVPEAINYPDDVPDDDDNKLPSYGLQGSNRVITTRSGGPFAAEKFGRGVVDYGTGHKETTIAPVKGYTPDMSNT